jgi:hypothetical protein
MFKHFQVYTSGTFNKFCAFKAFSSTLEIEALFKEFKDLARTLPNSKKTCRKTR